MEQHTKHNNLTQGRPQDLGGGGPRFFFSDCALLGGFGGMLLRENVFKRCNLVRFRVYFDQILSLFFFKNYHSLYKKINILDKLLLWGITQQEIFENMLRLVRFGVYLETKMAIFMKKSL